MISFNNKFLAEYSPSVDEKIRVEFEQAYRKVCVFDPTFQKMTAIFEEVERCFSETTKTNYSGAVQKFLQLARNEARDRCAALGSATLGTCKPIGSEEIVPNMSMSFQTKITEPLSFSYLQGYLHSFKKDVVGLLRLCFSPEELQRSACRYLEKFSLFCDEYKERVIREEQDTRGLDLAIDLRKKEASEFMQKVAIDAAKVCNDCREIQPLNGKNWGCLKLKSEAVAIALAIKPLVLPGKEEEFEFFVRSACKKEDPTLCQKEWQFFSQFYQDTKDFINWYGVLASASNPDTKHWIQLLGTNLSQPEKKLTFETWISSPPVQKAIGEMNLDSLHQNAEIECKKLVAEDVYELLLEKFDTPHEVKQLWGNLSDSARQALCDASWTSLVVEGLRATDDCVPLLIEDRVELLIHLKALGFEDNDIRKAFQICLSRWSSALFNPYSELRALSKDKIESILAVKDNEDLCHVLLVGGSVELYEKIKMEAQRNRVYDYELTRRTVAAFLSFSELEMQTFFRLRSMSRSFRYYEDQILQLVSMTRNQQLRDKYVQLMAQPTWTEDPPPCSLTKEEIGVLQTLTDLQIQTFRKFIKNQWVIHLSSTDFVQIASMLHDAELWKIFEYLLTARLRSGWSFEEVRSLCAWFMHPSRETAQQFQDIPTSCYLVLPPEKRYVLAKYTDPLDPIAYFCCSEGAGHFEQDIAEVALCTVPTQPLIRFLGSKPFAIIKTWLEQPLQTPEGIKTRLETISAEQKRAILSRFRRFEGDMPLPVWMELFHTSEEEARNICTISEVNVELSEAETSMVHRLQAEVDVHDPHSLFQSFQGLRPIEVFSFLPQLLRIATETTSCGQRLFLSWCGAEVDPLQSNTCVSQNDQPFHCIYQGKPYTLHPRDLFNDIDFGVAAVDLRRKVLELMNQDPHFVDRLCSSNQTQLNPEQREVYFELIRLMDNLYRRFPQLRALVLGEPKTFSELLTERYRSSVQDYITTHEGNASAKKYDNNNYVHRYAFLFSVLLEIARRTIITHDHDDIQVRISNNVLFKLKALDPNQLSYSQEENPGMTHLADFQSDYLRHTLSPVTPGGNPIDISPHDFEAFVSAVQALDDTHYSALVHSYRAMLALQLDDTASQFDYFEAGKPYWPQGVDISAATKAMARIAGDYIGEVEVDTQELEPNKVYHWDRAGTSRYSSLVNVPKGFWHLGNFISALCKTYTPYDTTDHSGSCGINAFLLGRYGPDAYSTGRRNLTEDIVQFRRDIVQYARENRAGLIEEFSASDIDGLISKYATSTMEWNGREVWAIASRLYGHTIRIFNCDGHGYLFKTNAMAEVVPFDEDRDVFKPVNPEGRTLDLMLWGVHYSYLQRK